MQGSQPFHIMVSDTNHHVRDLLKRELEKEGYAVSCVGNGLGVYHTLCQSTLVDLIILDPELLYPYGHSLFPDVLDNNPTLQIIVHAYPDFISGLKPAKNVHLVEKSATSIHSLKKIIRVCSLQKVVRR